MFLVTFQLHTIFQARSTLAPPSSHGGNNAALWGVYGSGVMNVNVKGTRNKQFNIRM
jgi:hypothetical protein